MGRAVLAFSLRRGIRKNFLRMRKEFDLGRNDEENVNGFPGAFQIGHMSIKSYDLGVTVPGCVCVRVREGRMRSS